MTTDISPTGALLVTPIFRWGEAVLSLLRRSYVLPWPGTLPGAAHPKTCGSVLRPCGVRRQSASCVGVPAVAEPPPCTTPPPEAAKPSTLNTQCCRLQGCELSQCSLHNAPIFRLLLKVAVNGTHQCESQNLCGDLCPNSSSVMTTPARQPAPTCHCVLG